MSPIKIWHESLHAAFVEEAQQYGGLTEVVVVAEMFHDCLVIWSSSTPLNLEGPIRKFRRVLPHQVLKVYVVLRVSSKEMVTFCLGFNNARAEGMTPSELEDDCYARATVAFCPQSTWQASQTCAKCWQPVITAAGLRFPDWPGTAVPHQVDRRSISNTPAWTSVPLAIKQDYITDGKLATQHLRLVLWGP